MSAVEKLTTLELISQILKCTNIIIEILKFDGSQDIEVQPGAIMGLGDFYIEKGILIDELLRRFKNDSK